MKRIFSVILAVAMLLSLTACGKKSVSETGENIVQNTEKTTESDRDYDVKLDERSESKQYDYNEDDLSLVDTNSGQKITLGMTEAEIEAIAGVSEQGDKSHKVYDGVVVKYADGVAVSLIVANGQFKDGKETRYKTSRGVGIGTSAEDFKKAYGDSYTEGAEETAADGEVSKTASKATRYFEKDGSKIKFLGTTLDEKQKEKEDQSNYYIQDFMFSNSTGNIATIRVSLLSAATGGM